MILLANFSFKKMWGQGGIFITTFYQHCLLSFDFSLTSGRVGALQV
jgi:hypothetical protein